MEKSKAARQDLASPPPRSPDKRRKGKEGAGKNDLRGGGGFILRWGINF